MNVSNRKVHKFIGLVVSVQLLLWTISGIFFSFNKIDQIRGENYLKSVEQITPQKISRISFDEAKELVIEKTYLKPISVEEITEEKRGSEFRGRNLPLYKLSSLDTVILYFPIIASMENLFSLKIVNIKFVKGPDIN